MSIVDNSKELFDKSIEHLKSEIATLRTGRATPALVEDITVEAYGTKQPLKAVASITVADAKTINVDPWDRGLVQAVESAINNSDLGINPVNDGKLIRLPLPDLTKERRQELIKVLHKKLEAARISIRKIREDIRGDIDASEKAKDISEDEKYTLQDEVEKLVKEYNDKIKEIGEEKRKGNYDHLITYHVSNMGGFHDDLKNKMTEYILLGYSISKSFPRDELYALTSQCRRSLTSILLNYVEGYARRKKKVMLNFYETSYGSLQESITTFYLACKLEYINTDDYITLFNKKENVAKMLWSTIDHLQKEVS